MGRDIISSLEQQNSVLGKDFKINGYRIGCFSLSWGPLKNTYSKALSRATKSHPLGVGPRNLYFHLTHCPSQLVTLLCPSGKVLPVPSSSTTSALTGHPRGAEQGCPQVPRPQLCPRSHAKNPTCKTEVLSFLLRTQPKLLRQFQVLTRDTGHVWGSHRGPVAPKDILCL